MNNIIIALKSMRRNMSMTIASMTLVTVTLFVFGTVLIIGSNTNHLTNSVFESLKINVYLDPSIQEDEITQINKEILEVEGVNESIFSSPDDELNNLVTSFDDPEDQELMKTYFSGEDNPLYPVYEVTLESDEYSLEEASKSILEIEGVQEVDYGEEQGINSLVSALEFVQLFMLFLLIILFIITVFLITNTIKLTIDSRKNEISIMRLVGATNWFIRYPFIMEGLLIGLAGGLISLILVFYSYSYFLTLDIVKLFAHTLLVPTDLLTSVLIYLPIVGMVVGSIGSIIAIRNYLKV